MTKLRRKEEPAAGDPTPQPNEAGGSNGSGSDSDDSQFNTSYRAAFTAPGRPRKTGRGTGLVSDSDPDSDDAVFGEQMADYDAARSDDEPEDAAPDAEDSSVRTPRPTSRRVPPCWSATLPCLTLEDVAMLVVMVVRAGVVMVNRRARTRRRRGR